MIVQPNFLEHWKTRLLVKITKDPVAPLAVIRLWAHCQHSKRNEFPEMTPAQLASICHWEIRKPACHVAMIKAGFVDKLTPKGFAAHQWNEHNAQLIQKWHAGEKGGRPPKSENANELGQNEKPTDNRPITGTKPDKTRPDQTKSDMIEETKPNQTEQTPAVAAFTPKCDSPPAVRTDSDSSKVFGSDGRADGLTEGLASKMRVLPFRKPTELEVTTYLDMQFNGARQYAKPFLKAMNKSHWKDRKGQPVQDWKAMAKEYANAAARNQINQP
jgi:hypothetical protein